MLVTTQRKILMQTRAESVPSRIWDWDHDTGPFHCPDADGDPIRPN